MVVLTGVASKRGGSEAPSVIIVVCSCFDVGILVARSIPYRFHVNTVNRQTGISRNLILEIVFYSHLLEYHTNLVACSGANWQQCNQATVANGILKIGKRLT